MIEDKIKEYLNERENEQEAFYPTIEQQAMNNRLKKLKDELEKKIDALEKRLERVEKRL